MNEMLSETSVVLYTGAIMELWLITSTFDSQTLSISRLFQLKHLYGATPTKDKAEHNARKAFHGLI